MENQCESGHIDLFYGDETGVSELAYVPYGWQLKDENLAIQANHGRQINCFGILSRANNLFSKITTNTINADFIVDFFEEFSFKISKQTVVVLDNARIHVAQKVKADAARNESVIGKKEVYILSFYPHIHHI